MNQNPRRPRFFLLPLVLLAWSLALLASTVLGGYFEERGGIFGAPSPEAQARVLDTGVTRAVAFATDGNSDAAVNALAGTVHNLGETSEAYVATGRLVTGRGEPKLAVRFLTTATANKALSWDPNLWAALANAQTQTGDTNGAAKSAREADASALAAFGQAGKTQPGQSQEQIEQAARFLSVGSYFQTVKKDNGNAARAYREAVRIAPNHYLTLNNLGYLLADTGTTKAEWTEALQLTRRAVELAPGDPTVADSYGWALYRLGDYAGARRVLRPAVDNMPMSVELRRHLAAVYDALNLPDQAQIERERATRLDPNGATP